MAVDSLINYCYIALCAYDVRIFYIKSVLMYTHRIAYAGGLARPVFYLEFKSYTKRNPQAQRRIICTGRTRTQVEPNDKTRISLK